MGTILNQACVACEQAEEQHQLVRLALAPHGEVLVDYRKRIPGDHVWVHPRRECVASFEANPKAYFTTADTAEVRCKDLMGQLYRCVMEGVRNAMSLCAASGGVVGGNVALVEALKSSEIEELIISMECSPRTRALLERHKSEGVNVTVVDISKVVLGKQVGKAPRAAIGLQASGGIQYATTQLRLLRELG